jgi:DNA-binding NarL/FixJ family response regulator
MIRDIAPRSIGATIEEQIELTPARPRPANPRPVWIKGPATLASLGLQRALATSATRCHRGELPPLGEPSAVVVCTTEDPEGLITEVKEIRRAAPEAAVVVLGSSPDPELARAAVGAGARGFLHTGMPPEQVARAVSVAVGGEIVLPRALLKELLKELVERTRPADLSVLRPRQREILGLLAEGLSNAQIARRLYLSESTVKQHLRRAYKLLGVKNRLQAVRMVKKGNPPTPSREKATGEKATGQQPALAAGIVWSTKP